MHFLDVTLFTSLLMFLFISFCIIAQNLFIAQMLFLFCTVNVRMRESLFLPTQCFPANRSFLSAQPACIESTQTLGDFAFFSNHYICLVCRYIVTGLYYYVVSRDEKNAIPEQSSSIGLRNDFIAKSEDSMLHLQNNAIIWKAYCYADLISYVISIKLR